MVRRMCRRRAALVVSSAIVPALAFSAVAVASPLSAPVLKKPGPAKRVHAGVVTLVVFDPGVPKDVSPVYVTVSTTPKRDKNGKLKNWTCKSCTFVALHPWHGHTGYWIYKSAYNFPGYWAVTPQKYYWQAEHTAPLCQARGCEVVSAVHSFRIVG